MIEKGMTADGRRTTTIPAPTATTATTVTTTPRTTTIPAPAPAPDPEPVAPWTPTTPTRAVRQSLGKVWALADRWTTHAASYPQYDHRRRRSRKIQGAEAFWPTTLDRESHKAARILQSFCKDGFYEEEMRSTAEGPLRKEKVRKVIPAQVIAGARALAIFTTMRTGLWIAGSGGSGVLVARHPDGSWSPPSGIMVDTAGLEFLIGVDLYDAVLVINSDAGLEAVCAPRCLLGGPLVVRTGPVAVAVAVGRASPAPGPAPAVAMWAYVKSRGFLADVALDGTLISARTDENERFYGERMAVAELVAGKPRRPPAALRTLTETLKAAQGDRRLDGRALPTEPAPADLELDRAGRVFGIPDDDDPDPYGVRALERAGLAIREAGSRSRPSSDQFEYRPAPTSPIYPTFQHRRSASTISAVITTAIMPTDPRPRLDPGGPSRRMTSTATQTTPDESPAAPRPDERIPDGAGHDGVARAQATAMKTPPPSSPLHYADGPTKVRDVVDDDHRSVTGRDRQPFHALDNNHDNNDNANAAVTDDATDDVPTGDATDPDDTDDDDEPHPPEYDDVLTEEPVAVQVQTPVRMQAKPPLLTKARLVTIRRRTQPPPAALQPPPLPARSAARHRLLDAHPLSIQTTEAGRESSAPAPAPASVVDTDPETETWTEAETEMATETMTPSSSVGSSGGGLHGGSSKDGRQADSLPVVVDGPLAPPAPPPLLLEGRCLGSRRATVPALLLPVAR
ncbi:MAG: hypothetical protein M1826_003944 [Phylliscum demangeonii]|nr:MAG: hypothetical protein M1826_003944 [Phylliscum demangeonii]